MIKNKLKTATLTLLAVLSLFALAGCKTEQIGSTDAPTTAFSPTASLSALTSASQAGQESPTPKPASPTPASALPSVCPHVQEPLPALLPTCTKEGLSAGSRCSLCGLILEAQSPLPPAGHLYAEGICTFCGAYEESKGLRFERQGDCYTVTGIGTFSGSTLVIPQMHQGLPVTEIAADAFYNAYTDDPTLTAIKRLILPEGITVIGNNAFAYLTALEELSLPEGLEQIGDKAFAACFSLKSVTLPESVREIGKSAFANCSSLSHVILKKEIERIDAFAFYGVKTLFITAEKRPEGWHISYSDALCTVYFANEWYDLDGTPVIKQDRVK